MITKKPVRRFLAIGGGFALSFVAFGALWIGTPWAGQALMFFPFFLLSYFTSRGEEPGDGTFLWVIGGALPLGAIMMMFRDKSDSHLMPVSMVAAWLAGILAGRLALR